jgi:SAM-dependent methyltransferase
MKSLTDYNSKNTLYRRIVNLTKKNRLLYGLAKIVNPGRKIEIKTITTGLDNVEDTVLDVGCGDGYWTNHFSNKCKRVVGIDPFVTDLDVARQYAVPKTEFLLGSGENLPFAEASFSKVVSVCVFEHLKDDAQAFKEIRRVLAEDGSLLATVDSLHSPYLTEEFRDWHMRECYCSQLYTKESITEKLQMAGFRNVEAHYIMGTRIGVWWEVMSEKLGAFVLLLSPVLYPLLMILERSPKHSGFKIFVKATK